MTAEQAKQIITDTVSEQVTLCTSKGLIASGKAYYSDKALRECTEFSEHIILVFGAIKLGTADMDEEDYCTYGLCCETKVGTVDDAELEKEIADFKADVQKMLEEIESAPSPADKIREINLRQEEEAEKSMQEFNLEMKKMKLKLYGGLGIFAAIAAVLIILGFII